MSYSLPVCVPGSDKRVGLVSRDLDSELVRYVVLVSEW